MDVRIKPFGRQRLEILTGIDTESCTQNEQMNERFELAFSVGLSGKNEIGYDMAAHESSVFLGGQEFVIKKVSESASGNTLTKKVNAVHVSYTVQDYYQYAVRTGTMRIATMLSHALSSNHLDFSYEADDPDGLFTSVERENFGDANALKLLQDITKDFGAVMVADNKHFRFVPQEQFGEKTNEVIRYRYNTDQAEISIDTYDLRTQIRGFGKKKEGSDTEYVFTPVTYTSPAVERWGLRIAQPVRDERYTVRQSMLERLERELSDQPSVSGTVSLTKQTNVRMGDYVRFVYEPLRINQFVQIVGVRSYPLSQQKPPEITLNNNRTSLMQTLARRT